uniref:SUEL-type lectin domain-containing protein n=1 Tax=Oryzias latipes TaxID=8090 RepID=A0A3B3H9N1_ORYLA
VLGHAGLYLVYAFIYCSSIFFMISSWSMAATSDMPTERVTTCVDGVVHRLSCELGGVISVQTSLSGGEDSVACSEGGKAEEVSSTGCSDMAVVDIVKKCDGVKVCELTSSDLGVSGDSRGTTKYLQTVYTCQPAVHHVTCEHSLKNQRDDFTCVFTVFFHRCNGKNSCIIKAGNSEFGDPCVGTFNHLEVAYTCNCN